MENKGPISSGLPITIASLSLLAVAVLEAVAQTNPDGYSGFVLFPLGILLMSIILWQLLRMSFSRAQLPPGLRRRRILLSLAGLSAYLAALLLGALSR